VNGYKFVCANTLIGLPEKSAQMTMFEADEQIKELKELREKYLRSYGEEKKQIEVYFREVQGKMFDHALNWHGRDSQTLKLSQWDPFSDEPCPWFDPEWMFGINIGFDVAIGNPPYGLLNKRQNKGQGVPVTKEQLKYYKRAKEYKPALGGMLNIFRLFIVKSINILKPQGIFTEIFPLAFVADKSIASLRKHILQNFTVLSIDAFPERDDPKKRIFEAAKMSVCILKLIKTKDFKPSFFVRINTGRFIDYLSEVSEFGSETVKLLDSENYTVPLVSQKDIKVLVKIYEKSKRFAEIGHCYTGEVDMSFGSPYFSQDPKNAILLKGAIIDRYIINKKMSQGEIVYLDSAKFLAENSGKKLSHHKLQRIVMQGITGVNEKIRLKMTLAKNAFCANSVNYLIVNEKTGIEMKCLLGLFNSSLMNYVFRKFSTNSNVNGYEVDNLPIPNEIPESIQVNIKHFVDKIFASKKTNPEKDTSSIEKKIDQMVYKLYGLTEKEIAIVEGKDKQ